MRKHLPLLVLVGIVVIFGGYLVYSTFTHKPKPIITRDSTTPSAAEQKTPAAQNSQEPSSGQTQPAASDNQAKKSVVPDSNPSQGEVFVYGKVQAVAVEERIITIDQQMDDNSVKISPNVPVKKEAVIQNKQQDMSLAQIKPGDNVGIVLTKDGHARAVIVE